MGQVNRTEEEGKKVNIVPQKPEFYRINNQRTKRDGDHVRVNLEVYRGKEVGMEIEKVRFLIPLRKSNSGMPFKVFTLGLSPDAGWTLLYDEEEEKTVTVIEKVSVRITQLRSRRGV